MDVTNTPITRAEVTTRVRRVVVNEMILDQWMRDLVVEELSEYVYEITKEAVLNAYNSNPLQWLFGHPNPQVHRWFTRGIVTYANGQDFEGGRRYKAHIVHLFLVTYPTTISLNSASLKATSTKEVTVDSRVHCAKEGKFKVLAL